MLERALVFHYKDFKLTKQDAHRIDAVIQQLLNDGKITKDPVRERLWLGSRIVQQMAVAMLNNAINNGTKSWDVTLSCCLTIVLQSALACRAGDIQRSKHYTGEEYLQWKHITLKATGATVQNPKLTMLVTLLYRKGHK